MSRCLRPVPRSLAAWLAFVCALLLCAPASALPLRVRGTAEIDVWAIGSDEGFILFGEARDDTGASLNNAELVLELLGDDGDPIEVPDLATCAPEMGPARARRERVEFEADPRGRFCFESDERVAPQRVRVLYEGSDHYGAAKTVVRVEEGDIERHRTVIRFEPAPDRIDLDRDSLYIAVSIGLDRRDSRRPVPATIKREGLVVELRDEHGERVATTKTGGDGRARFTVETEGLGEPGAGALEAVFEGNDQLAPSSTKRAVIRFASAHPSLADEVDAGDPEDGIVIHVEVDSPHGTVSSGVVEALRDRQRVGTAVVEEGRAELLVVFPRGRDDQVPIRLRYIPATPWWIAGPPTEVEVPIEGPSIWRQLALALAVSGLLAWVVLQWRRAPKPAIAEAAPTSAPPSGRPGVDVVATIDGAKGWSGTVVDAHDGLPITGASLIVRAPSLTTDGIVVRVNTDERGHFAFEASSASDLTLEVEGDFHALHSQSLPAPSVLNVSLVTRRRQLLTRLVRWARKQGAPWIGSVEPTPGHVRRVARRSDRDAIETWATKVEQVAFGKEPVDREAAEAVAAAEPRAKNDNYPPVEPAAR